MGKNKNKEEKESIKAYIAGYERTIARYQKSLKKERDLVRIAFAEQAMDDCKKAIDDLQARLKKLG